MLRTPLSSISGNRRRHSEYTSYQRGLIGGAVAAGVTPHRMKDLFGIPITTTKTITKNVLARHNGDNKPRSGRPKKLSIRDERHILRIIHRDPKITYKNLIAKSGVDVSHDTIYRMLKEQGITNWIAKKRPLLTPENAGLRYQWALRHENWKYEDWEKVIWSDECSVERGTGKRRQWVFRTPEQKWDKDMITPYKKGKDISVMVWACFWGMQRSDLYALSRDFEFKKHGYSASSYIQVLDDNLLGCYEPGLIFMQDNAPIHTAKRVKKWFEENGIIVMKWPPYSPDLNPIEHLWFLLKEAVYKINPDIENVTGGDEKVRETLFDALSKAWEQLDEYYLHDLVWSMEKRVKALIKSEGWYTKY